MERLQRLQITIQGEIHSSKNSRQIFRNKKTGRPFVAKSDVSKADEFTFAMQLQSQREIWQRMTRGINFPVSIVFCFRRATRRRFDYLNMAQGILDAMVKAGYLEDDNADIVIPNFAPYVVDKSNPGCDILIG